VGGWVRNAWVWARSAWQVVAARAKKEVAETLLALRLPCKRLSPLQQSTYTHGHADAHVHISIHTHPRTHKRTHMHIQTQPAVTALYH